MKNQNRLLIGSALVELGGGLLIILFPSFMLQLLFGVPSNSLADMVGQVAGIALVALGIACWIARDDAGGPARLGTVRAITVYNGSVGLLLIVFGLTGRAFGIVLWLFAILHVVEAVLFAFTLARPERKSQDGSGDAVTGTR